MHLFPDLIVYVILFILAVRNFPRGEALRYAAAKTVAIGNGFLLTVVFSVWLFSIVAFIIWII